MSQQPADVGRSLTHGSCLRGCTKSLAKSRDFVAHSCVPPRMPWRLCFVRGILGTHMDGAGKESVTGADQNLADVREAFFKACGRPFDLRKELPTPLESVPTQIQLYEWGISLRHSH